MFCGECKQECEIIEYDDSFDHEFGTEKRSHFGSDCCDGDVYRNICQDCGGLGETMGFRLFPSGHTEIIEECGNCEGIGLNDQIDFDDYWIEDLENLIE